MANPDGSPPAGDRPDERLGPGYCAALLRAVNVGGRRVKMAALRDALREAGLEEVRTLQASGNVVLRVPEAGISGVARRISAVVEERFGMQSDVVVRTHDQLLDASQRHPFQDDEERARMLHVMFLQDLPAPEAVRSLDPDRSPPDRFAVDGREIFIHYPDGSARSKLTVNWFERQLDTVGTKRNLNTVMKLAEMTAPAP